MKNNFCYLEKLVNKEPPEPLGKSSEEMVPLAKIRNVAHAGTGMSSPYLHIDHEELANSQLLSCTGGPLAK